MHDQRAIAAMLAFASDFRPDVWIEGGDDVDCGPVSHWLKEKMKSSSELRLQKDFAAYNDLVVKPIDAIMAGKRKALPSWAGKGGRKRKLHGNHENWIDQLIDKQPQLEGLIELDANIDMAGRGWTMLEHGEVTRIGKLAFTHGDTLGSTAEFISKAAVLNFESNIRFGHFHTHQLFTKHSPVDARVLKSGLAVPCLCHRAPNYQKRNPNKWSLGFAFGYVFPDGSYSDYVANIVNSRFAAEGKVYQG